MRFLLLLLINLFLFVSCADDNSASKGAEQAEILKKPLIKFGYNLDDFIVISDTIEHGESFGEILDRHHIWYPKILEISKKIKKIF